MIKETDAYERTANKPLCPLRGRSDSLARERERLAGGAARPPIPGPEEPRDHPPSDAEIALSIDGHENRWAVYLPNGIRVARRKTTISLS